MADLFRIDRSRTFHSPQMRILLFAMSGVLGEQCVRLARRTFLHLLAGVATMVASILPVAAAPLATVGETFTEVEGPRGKTSGTTSAGTFGAFPFDSQILAAATISGTLVFFDQFPDDGGTLRVEVDVEAFPNQAASGVARATFQLSRQAAVKLSVFRVGTGTAKLNGNALEASAIESVLPAGSYTLEVNADILRQQHFRQSLLRSPRRVVLAQIPTLIQSPMTSIGSAMQTASGRRG